MEHRWYEERLLDFQDAETSAEDRREMLHHLESCAACRERLQRWEAARRELTPLQKVPTSEPFVARVMAQVTAPAARRIGWKIQIPAWIYPELGLAAAAALLFFMVGSTPQRPVSAEGLLVARFSPDMEWVGTAQPSQGAGLEILWEEG